MSMKIHPKRGLLMDKSVHEKSPFDNIHKKSPILKKRVHEMSLSTKCLHPIFEAQKYLHFVRSYLDAPQPWLLYHWCIFCTKVKTLNICSAAALNKVCTCNKLYLGTIIIMHINNALCCNLVGKILHKNKVKKFLQVHQKVWTEIQVSSCYWWKMGNISVKVQHNEKILDIWSF